MRSIIVLLVAISASLSAQACVHCAYAAAVQGSYAAAGIWLPSPGSDSVFTKSKSATATLEMKNATFMYDTNEWSMLDDSLPNESFDGQFQHVDGNIRGMVMSVKEFSPADDFLGSFVGGMEESYPGTKLVSKRTVIVNGEKMLEIQIDMPVDQVPVRYYGFLHAGQRGVAVALAACHGQLFQEVTSIVKSFTSGIMVTRSSRQTKAKQK